MAGTEPPEAMGQDGGLESLQGQGYGLPAEPVWTFHKPFIAPPLGFLWDLAPFYLCRV